MWRERLKSIAWGGVGVLAVLLLWHAWTDHVAFHQIVDMINKAATAQVPPAK